MAVFVPFLAGWLLHSQTKDDTPESESDVESEYESELEELREAARDRGEIERLKRDADQSESDVDSEYESELEELREAARDRGEIERLKRDAAESLDIKGGQAVVASAMCATDKCQALLGAKQKRSKFSVSRATSTSPGHTIPDFRGRLSAFLQKSQFDPGRDKLVAVTSEADTITVYSTEQDVSAETLGAARNGWDAAANVSNAQGAIGPGGRYIGVNLGSPLNAAEFVKVSGAYEVPAAALKVTTPMFIG